MTSYIALLRAVNVGGFVLPMAELRAMLDAMGFDHPRTLLQSGNAVFGVARATSAATLETKLEAEAKRRFGKPIAFLVRSAREWNGIIERNPFADAAKNDPSHLLVMALKGVPDSAAVKTLRARYDGPESIHVDGREAYLVYPEGIGRSRLTAALLERGLGFAGTARNWNTVLKLAAAAQA